MRPDWVGPGGLHVHEDFRKYLQREMLLPPSYQGENGNRKHRGTLLRRDTGDF